MKTSILTAILLLTACFTIRATTDCIWTSSKAGLTIQNRATCNFRNQTFLDSIVNRVVLRLHRKDTSLKILVLVNHGQLSFPNTEYSNFFSIGYDTLRQIDGDYIFNYYWYQDDYSIIKNRGLNRFESEKAPLDINSTRNRTINEIGIKIIYDRDWRLGENNWTDISEAIIYAANRLDFIKKHQIRDTVRYNANGWYVSLRTLDIIKRNRTVGNESSKNLNESKGVGTANNYHFVIAGIGLLLALGLFLVRKKYSR